mmetsp:Transcript_120818/g.258063  ORF Transcript_120818/g.258063 Transcript_120818/m.258063 type:complete len:407 (-) Transcript_120818:121-1341(-)
MTSAGMMTAAEREKMKTLHGEWRTPIPIEFVDDDERNEEGRRCYRGKERHEIRMSVERKEEQIGDIIKVKRLLTLRYFDRTPDGHTDLSNERFTMTGRANIRYDRIKWDNGACWVRACVEKENLGKMCGMQKVMHREASHSAPLPDFEAGLGSMKLLQNDAFHSSLAPDWNEKVAGIGKVLVRQLQDVHRKHALPEAMNHDMAAGDMEASPLSEKVFASDASHTMFCSCSCCGSKPQVSEDDAEEPFRGGDAPVPPEPEPDIVEDGFFNGAQLDDIIDRINDVVGVWGISEEREREYIKPPCVAMNSMIKAAMDTFMESPLVKLIHYMMDEALDIKTKAIAFGRYLHENFIMPLCEALMKSLSGTFETFTWIKNQVRKVMAMMSQMVTDEVMTRTVTTLNDSDLVD